MGAFVVLFEKDGIIQRRTFRHVDNAVAYGKAREFAAFVSHVSGVIRVKIVRE